jgi:tRNA-2-methylthio-N6-dimethylallyladenosine synthase
MAPMIHFPIQSGSDKILSAMNRRYTFAEYYEKVKKIRERIPEASISADIIVGFPGETDEDFELTLDAMRKIRYDAVYSFAYSKRSGTPAAELSEQVPEHIKKDRLQRLIALQTEIMGDINKSLLGKTVVAFVEGISKKNKDMISARTATGKIIHIKACEGIAPGDKINVKITKTMSYQMYGELEKGEK